jgi:hypothetical protein
MEDPTSNVFGNDCGLSSWRLCTLVQAAPETGTEMALCAGLNKDMEHEPQGSNLIVSGN